LLEEHFMPGVAELIREIHRLRRHAREMQQELDRAPIVLKAHKTKAEKIEAAFHEAQDALKKLKVATHEKEVSLKTCNQQIAKYEKQRDEVTDTKQMEAIKHQLATTREKIAALEDEILSAMAETDERTSQLPSLEAAAAAAKKTLAAFELDQKERNVVLADELKKAQAGVVEVEAKLPADIRQQYQRMVNAFGADAFAAVEGPTCTFCNMQITSQQQIEVQAGEFVLCRSCGRGLYLPG
jgi:predicted  nucleic acid-binding Zn-ribbon protein